MDLEGRVAIVTGAAGAGIGQADAWSLARNGANVVVSDTHPQRPVSLAEKIRSTLSVDAVGVQCDVSNRAQVNNMVEQTVSKFGRIDILVNNAGFNRVSRIWEMKEDVWKMILDINLTGTFNCTQAVLPIMMKQKSGIIINMASIDAYMCSPMDGAAYASAKAGVIAFTKAVAKEVGAYNIRVNVIAPSVIWNEYLSRVVKEEELQRLREDTPLGRFGSPEEVAETVAFLSSDKSSFISGAVISVTGGYNTW